MIISTRNFTAADRARSERTSLARRLLLSSALCALAAPAHAQVNRDIVIVTAAANPEDPPVVAAARERLSETPGAVAVVSAESYATRYAPGVADLLRDVPGVYAQKKWGGDTRLSIRGSGIGNANHLRGTLLAQDGIPFNEADGFGDFQLIDPSIARYTEVYKGGNALRYGGALLGGAVNLVTPNGKTVGAPASIRVEGGSYGTVRGHVEAGGTKGAWDGFVAASAQTVDGWRVQSEGDQQYGSANIGYTFGDDREVRAYLSGGYVHQQIPGSLTLSQALNTPEMANPTNTALNYQRDMRSLRSVVQTRWRLSSDTVFEGGVYATWKDLDHPIFQVIDQESRNWGAFGRIDWDGELFGKRADAFYGVSYRSGDLDANQWINTRGSWGRQTAKSRQNATGLDVFGEGRLFVNDNLAVVAGGSYGKAERDYQSFALPGVTTTFNLTTGKDYDWFSPRVGLLWRSEGGAQVYANLTKSVEPPNFGSLSPVATGFQPLQPQEAWTGEIGTRGRNEHVIWDVAVYRAELTNELLNYTVNPALGIPAATFNAGDTLHMGLEAGLDWMISDVLRLRQTYMWSRFEFEGDKQYGDNRLPVVPEHFYRAELRYHNAHGFYVAPAVEWQASDTWVDYANTLKSPGYTILNLGIGRQMENGFTVFLDARNLTDEAYVSNFTAVTNARTASTAVFFPGDGRSLFVGVSLAF
jgi:iron complex outermembrane receptor protein